MKRKEAKKMFISFGFEVKQSEKTLIPFRLEAKQKNQKRNEAKWNIFGIETKQKYGVFISLWLEAKNSKRKEAKKINFFSRECAKRISFRFVSLWSEIFFYRNWRTLLGTPCNAVPGAKINPAQLHTLITKRSAPREKPTGQALHSSGESRH